MTVIVEVPEILIKINKGILCTDLHVYTCKFINYTFAKMAANAVNNKAKYRNK